MSQSAPASASLVEGTLVAGKYRVGRPLGAGGMAEVYEAEHVDLGTRLAIKVLRPELTRSPTVVQRFSREAQSAAQLESEHVARVIDVGQHEQLPFIVMERLDGDDLAARLAKVGPLPLADAVDHLLQAGQALAEAHARGIIHRDIKPSNLFLAQRPPDDTRIKVLDFGIAKAVSTDSSGELTRTRDVLGSPLYMSPEQLLASSKVGPTSDVWSLGVVLQELITGQPPFDGPSVAAIHAAILEREPAPLLSTHPREIAAIIGRCLRKDPTERYQNIRELAAALAPHGTDDARNSLRAIQSWATVSQRTARETSPMADFELDSVADTNVADTEVPDSFARPGGVTDTSWDTDTDATPRRSRGLLIGLALMGVTGVLAFVALRDAPEATAPEATAPEATAPEATAPEATAPETRAPATTAPAPAPSATPVATTSPPPVPSTTVAPAPPAPTPTPRIRAPRPSPQPKVAPKVVPRSPYDTPR